MTVGSHIRDCRLAAKLSLRELASRLNTTAVSLGEIERGKADVGPAMVERLVEYLPGFDVKTLRGTIAADPCKGWTWLPMMRAIVRSTGEAWIVLAVDDPWLRAVRDDGAGEAPCSIWCRSLDPDLDAHGTVGAIENVLLPAAWPEHTVEIRRHTMGHEVFIRESAAAGCWGDVAWSSGWVPGHAIGQTLFHALEAAAARADATPHRRDWPDSATDGYSSNARGHRPGGEDPTS